MFEDKTKNNIHADILANIPNTYEKTVGFPVYDITKSFAIEGEALYTGLITLVNKLDVDKLTGDELTKYVLQRKGIVRKAANAAKGIVAVNGNGTVNIGDLFSTPNGVQFKSIETKMVTTTADINVVAVVAGAGGIVGAGSITQMPVTIQGIASCINNSPTYDGYETESDDDLRERYYEALRIPATSGNRYHYIQWAKEIVGVGDAKVISLWNGPNTVKVVLIDSDKKPANADLISRAQTYIDPGITGNGSGQAPIGAYCTVVSAAGLLINIEVDIQELPNFTLDEVKNNIINNLTNYLKEIAFKQDYASYAKVGSIILNTEGVEDYTTLKINNTTANIPIENEEVAILGVVTTT